jgi:hypothetical protein
MKRLNGWQRLWVVWVVSLPVLVLGLALIQYPGPYASVDRLRAAQARAAMRTSGIRLPPKFYEEAIADELHDARVTLATGVMTVFVVNAVGSYALGLGVAWVRRGFSVQWT